ncbi:MAG: DUF2726 domain-containing protein, partial [Bacteroidota bacterium]
AKHKEKFSLLRTILGSLGLSADAVGDIIDRITDFLSERSGGARDKAEYPYFLRDDFLSAAEYSFLMVLRLAVSDSALIYAKVSLSDLFYVRSSDASEFRTYTNRIDRKHVDFLLCDPKTVRPIAGIELDDKSHGREDRQARDEFVEGVFKAAKLPLIRVPAKHSYSVSELSSLLQPYLKLGPPPAPTAPQEAAPRCPKCGSEMFLRTARSGPNQGQKFWGCSRYPQCRGIINVAAVGSR